MPDTQPTTTTPPADEGLQWSSAPAAVSTGTPAPAAAQPQTDDEGLQWESPSNSTPSADQDQGFLHGLYAHTVQPLVQTGATVKQLLSEPTWEGQRKIVNDTLHGMVQPQIDTYKRGADELQSARDGAGGGFLPRADLALQGVGNVVASAVPFLGPQISQTGQDIQTKPNQGAGEVVGDLATALLPKVVEGVKGKAAQIAENVQTAPSRSLAGLIAKSPGMGDNFDPKAVSNSVEPLIQQSAKANPDLYKVATDPESTPEESYKAFQGLVNKAQTAIDQAHRQVLGKVANTPVSVRPVLEAMDASMPQGLDKFAPKDAAAIRSLRDNIANAKTLGDLNGLRVYLNTELSPEFKMDNVAVGRSAATDKAMRAALSATKDAYYDNLQHVTGQDFRSLKMAESNLMTYQEALANSRRAQFAAQAAHEAPTTGKQKIAKAGEVVGAVLQGNKAKLAQSALFESPMAPTQAHIQRFLKNIPDNVPSTFDNGAPVEAPQPRQLESSSTVPDESGATYQHEKGAPTRPAVVTPFQQRPLLPETAGQGLITDPAQAQPHPGVNEPTAVTRTRQPIFKKPEPTPARTINVGPDGTATIQRPALPAPPTKIKTLKTRKILSGN